MMAKIKNLIAIVVAVVTALAAFVPLWTYRSPPRIEIFEHYAIDMTGSLGKGLKSGAIRCELDRGALVSTEPPMPFRDLHLARYTILNKGDQPFKWEAMTEPLVFSIDGDGEVLRVEPDVSLEGPRLLLNYVKGGSSVRVATDYLNGGQSVSFSVIHSSNKASSLLVSGRAFDHPRLEIIRPSPEKPRPSLSVWSFVIACLSGTISGGLTEYLIKRRESREEKNNTPDAENTNAPHTSVRNEEVMQQ